MTSKFVFVAAFMVTAPVFAAFVLAAFILATPGAAQVRTQNDQGQLAIQDSATGAAPGSTTAPRQAPITGVFCIEEMTANFCNVVTGPNTGGYGARSGSGSTSSSAPTSSSASASGFATTRGAGGGTASIPPCPAEPPFNELCD